MNIINYQREVACFGVPDYGILSITTDNNAGGVEFDFLTIWGHMKEIGLEKIPYVYMIHSHPPGHYYMSSTDRNMIHGWCQALNKPICFIIATDIGYTFYLCQCRHDKPSIVNRDNIDIALNDGLSHVMSVIYYLSLIDAVPEDSLTELCFSLSNDINLTVLPELEEYLG